ncbi:hypothetical protein I3760_06G074300 [Carya illinoinensis]|nr:hypothetical protein I3760_06G074300 [Carya illinoinensis]
MEPNLKLQKDEGVVFHDPTLYRKLVEKLLYLTHTRPDLSYSVNLLSQFMDTPRVPHYDAVVKVLRYIKGTPRNRRNKLPYLSPPLSPSTEPWLSSFASSLGFAICSKTCMFPSKHLLSCTVIILPPYTLLRIQYSTSAKNILNSIAISFVTRFQPGKSGLFMCSLLLSQEARNIVGNIAELLKNGTFNKIGVWGMAGGGKSTLMREIARKVNKEKLFDEVAMAIVLESPDLRPIQGEIADTLGLKFDQETEKGRASQLQRGLMNDKKILVILDDIWKPLDLVEIGIIPSERCKIVLTSRNRDVLTCRIGTQKDFAVQTLFKEEAWDLFEKMAATEVAKECAGLPIALVTISKALKNKSLGEWKDALRQLRRLVPRHVIEMLKTVYSPIEFSYKKLESQRLKSLLLLCAQLSAFVFYRDLLKYNYGYGFFHDGIDTLEEARNMLDTLLGKLRDSCLILESFIHGFRMHDVVRDVATIIASEDHNMFVIRDDGGLKTWPKVDSLKRCKAFSILGGDIDQLPNEMECPELRFFHLCLEDRSLQIPDTFFQGMDKLNVLDLTKTQLPSLPLSLLFLRNLQTLCSDQCMLGDISGIGKLKNLVILSLLHSDISKLSREIGSLVHLRLLDLSNCSKLEMIPPNVISSLIKLEELYMENNFVQWEDEGPNDERKNASLVELNHLSNLTSLEIQIPNVNNLPKDLMFEKLERYTKCIGDVWDWIDSTGRTSRRLKLKFNPSFQLQSWVKLLWKRVEDLHLDELNGVESVIPEMDRKGLQQLKHLHIQNSAELKYILNLRTPVIAFPTLETFVLENMISLEEICHGKLRLTSFKNLRVLKVISCDKLKYVFSLSIARGLPLLEELEVKHCNNMDAIVKKEEEQAIEDGDMIFTKNSFMRDGGEISHDPDVPLLHDQHLWSKDSQIIFMFQNLQVVNAWRCENLKSIFLASTVRYLEQLKEIVIVGCGVEEIVAVERGGDQAIISFSSLETLHLVQMDKLEILWHDQVAVSSFSNTHLLMVIGCENLLRIFQSNLLTTFQSLTSLHIMDCGLLEAIFERHDALTVSVATSLTQLEHLTNMTLSNLPKLKWFLQGQHTLEFPSLKQLQVLGCFAPSFLARLQNLSKLQVYYSGWEEIFLNELLDREKLVPRLRKLELHCLPMLTHLWKGDTHEPCPIFHTLDILQSSQCAKLKSLMPHSVSLQNLTNIKISNCHGLINLVTSSTAKTLVLLKKMTISECKRITEIVAIEDGEANVMLTFNNLTYLELDSLPKLANFCSQGYSFVLFPSLEKVIMRCCTEMKTFCHRVVRAPKLKSVQATEDEDDLLWEQDLNTTIHWLWEGDYDTQLLFMQKVSEQIFPNIELLDREKLVSRLRKLKLHCLPMLTCLWKGDAHEPYPIFHTLDTLQVSQYGKLKSLMLHLVSLQNLTNLKILSCHGLINLVTSSTAKTLVQLKEMIIGKCKRNTEIIAMEDEIVTIEDGEANLTITFNNLTYLELDSLPNLANFCSKCYSFVLFPSLEKVIMRCCTEMKTFYHRVLRVPKLKSVQAIEDEDDLHWEQDLNTTIHWLWEADYDTQLLFTQKISARIHNFPNNDMHIMYKIYQ